MKTKVRFGQPLSAREKQVFDSIAKGMTSREIAAETGLVLSTIRSYVKAAYKKTGINKNTKVVAAADEAAVSHQRRGLTPDDYSRKEACYRIYKVALKSGFIVPQCCMICGAKAAGHHRDYGLPLDVIWLCHPHHSAAHMHHPVK